MSAGLPGLGLGGLFFIFSALLAPFPELWRTLRGRSDLAAWKAIGRQLAQALAMIVAIDLTLRLTYVALSATGAGDPPAADEATVLPLSLIGITTGLLVLVLCGAKLAELTLRARSGELPGVPETLPRVAPLRAVAFAAIAAVAWIALLATGASELSPLQQPGRGQIASRPEQDVGGQPQPAAVKPHPPRQGGPSASATKLTTTERNEAAGTPSDTNAPDGGGSSAGIAPSPAVAIPDTPPPKPAAPTPVATPEPQGSPASAPKPPPGAGGPPESTGPPEGPPPSEANGPAAEPPPQAPAKGLRDSG